MYQYIGSLFEFVALMTSPKYMGLTVTGTLNTPKTELVHSGGPLTLEARCSRDH